MRLLFASFELAPWAQSGGLGEAVAGLARALAARGHEVTCALPGHSAALRRGESTPLEDRGALRIPFPAGDLEGHWSGATEHGVSVELLRLPALYDRAQLYGYPDDALRLIAFSRAAAYRAEALEVDALVAHDHHAALSLCVLRTAMDHDRNRGRAAVQVVHNNAYQGRVPLENSPLTGLSPELLHPEGLEAWGSLCLLKGGLHWADRIVAVSPTYAQELQGEACGEGLEGVYRARAPLLTGIPNGIDTQRFDPRHDAALAAPFHADALEGKANCRRALCTQLDLEAPAPGRLLVAVGRLAAQKGWDILLESIEGLVAQGASLALLGDGEPALAEGLAAAAARHPGRVSFTADFDDTLARRLYAGGDAVLVPSRFEPCGLVQLIAQRYGTVPIAHAVGGLRDTIVDLSDPNGTGVLFSSLSTAQLLEATERVAQQGQKGKLETLQKRLLSLDVSWTKPAEAWEALLVEAIEEARVRV